MAKSIYDYLPTYNYIENNNLKGLQPGFVVAQMPVAATATFVKGGTKDKDNKIFVSGMVENGTICSISAGGIVDAAEGKPLFIVFNEPLNTLKDHDAFYATDLESEHLRLVQLIPGDEWMSTMKASDLPATVAGRIIEITKTDAIGMSDDWYACETMADGTEGHHYMFLG